jgi:AraC family ethanolamine operon transcriptional activator
VDVHTLLGSDQAPRVDGRMLATLRRRWLGSIRSLAAGHARVEPEELIADLVRTLAAGRVVDPFRTTPADRRRVVREAEEFALASPPGAATIVALCLGTGVSERTLHYAFVEVTGLGPAAYLKAARLNRARLDLMAGERARGRVEEVARRHGFDRPGDFAASYRRLFGTLPSADLGARRGVG